MLTITADQMAAFGSAALQRFKRDLVSHMSRQAPEHCRAIGTSTVMDVIELGVVRAAAYGLTNRGPVRTYIELMFLLGSYFDTDPQYPWAGTALTRDDMAGQMDRAGRLFDAADAYFAHALGEQGQAALRALRMLIGLVQDPPEIRVSRVADDLLEGFRVVYPEKCDWIGEWPLVRLIEASLKTAAEHGFTSEREIALVASLMFALGHRCFDDPLFPWISRTLNDPRIRTQAGRAARLERKMLTYAQHVLSGAEG